MTEQEYKRLEHAKRQYFVSINGTPVVILVDDKEEEIVAGTFEVEEYSGIEHKAGEFHAHISLKTIQDEKVLGYATFMMMGILETVKKEYDTGRSNCNDKCPEGPSI